MSSLINIKSNAKKNNAIKHILNTDISLFATSACLKLAVLYSGLL